ncbi:MAG: hypothetical protein RLZZ422_123 [Pseudomonadota bacterium]|jgi:ABC-type antimicrobial peptide transport system ATPase subunit
MAKGFKTGGRKMGSTNKVAVNVRELAQQHATEAIKVLFDIMNDPNAAYNVRIQAANILLERGYGKPRPESDPTDQEQSNKLTVRLVGVDGNERPQGLSKEAVTTIKRDILGIPADIDNEDYP